MHYISTRDIQAKPYSFQEVVLMGLAPDEGLFVPSNYPHFTDKQLKQFSKLTYQDLAYEIISPFIGSEIPELVLKELIAESYKDFSHQAIAPLKQINNRIFILELFHGPTFAFKDFALQFLAKLFNYFLQKNDRKSLIIGATSGDTGSAAISACRDCHNLDIVILHPHNKVSEIQRKQMTCNLAPNIHNLAIEGSFDDCQKIVKQIFYHQQQLLHHKPNLLSINSINWARIVAQIVYYFYAALNLGSPDTIVNFSVPTGNFGDIYAGYVAKKMGLPIDKLIIATNENDILHRFLQNNDYSKHPMKTTWSPSMDIQIASNFERFLFDLHDRDAKELNALMQQFHSSNSLSVTNLSLDKAKAIFDSSKISNDQTLSTIQEIYQKSKELLDPHTAIAVSAALSHNETNNKTIALATAHPAKFPSAVTKCHLSVKDFPEQLKELENAPEKYNVIANDLNLVVDYLNKHIR